MTELNNDGLLLDEQDLSTLSPSESDHNRLYLHDGTSEIDTGENLTTEAGLYLWDYNNFTWIPAGRFAELLDGIDSSELTTSTEFSNHTSDTSAHHAKYTDSEAQTAVDGASVSIQGGASATQSNLDTHTSDTTNPHSVTNTQVGAPSQSSHDTLRTDHDNHVADTTNPHSVTTNQINAVPTSEKGATGGIAELDTNGLVPDAQLPSIAISETYTVADEAERLNLSAERGDVAIQQDISNSFILKGTDPSVNSNWTELQTPSSPVQSVFGRTGDITATSGDYNHSQIGNQSTDDHHAKYTDSEAQTAVDGAAVSIQGTADSTQSDHDTLRTDHDNHVADTTNPHSVTNTQVGAPSQTDFDNHTGNTSNPHSVTAAQTGAVASSTTGEIYVSSTEPSNPSENDIWIQTQA